MDRRFERTGLLLGEEGLEKLARSRVAVFGAGGVGGYVIEALARSGVGALDVTDSDVISLSNINRQIIADSNTVGRYKVDVVCERVKAINPECVVTVHRTFFTPQNAPDFDFSQYDYVVDAIDTVTGKIGLITCAEAAGVPVISSMGAGNKLDPTAFCPLARVMRAELKKRGVKKLKVVYSKEKPIKASADDGCGRHAPGSVAFVPPVAGLIIAGEVIKDITGVREVF